MRGQVGDAAEHDGVVAAVAIRPYSSWSELVTLRPGDRYLLVNPFFHTFGYKAGVLACLLRGVTMLPEAVYDTDRILARMAAEQVTTGNGWRPNWSSSACASERRLSEPRALMGV
ncbi:hypothetical protein [Streptomyces sp. ISL-94]|uniref:hypothetical protein n=1 Tax=Streptomyces sp. ISL-94 TaxID=2819190 RepID=UPI001BE83488|nr:hypothetical protein [Streptomyces sp. ISL-94]